MPGIIPLIVLTFVCLCTNHHKKIYLSPCEFMLGSVNIFQINLIREMLNQLCMNQETMNVHEN